MIIRLNIFFIYNKFNLRTGMFEVRKLAKNKLWFIDIIKSAPGKVKSQYPDLDDSKYDFVYFSHVFILLAKILDYISAEAEIAKTTPEEKYKLF